MAFQFLTILPVRVRGGVSEKDIAGSAAFFPLVGAVEGLLALSGAMAALKLFSPEIAAGIVVLILMITNRGFHIDGLSDTFDALSVKSSGDAGADRQRRLSVMKDSRAGAAGVSAVVMAVLLKYLFISHLLKTLPPHAAYSALFLMPVFSKWAMVSAMHRGVSARKDGLGRLFIENTGPGTVAFSSLLVLLFCLLSAGLSIRGLKGAELFFLMSVLLYVFSRAASMLFKQRFGGLTGDNFGAIGEMSEIIFLAGASIWLQHFI
ncbi:MAG: adenosylcobinamide-GDP ribazoletransferase [Thermodesulfovibrionales bacterium]|nr:adenosylcobinamide-GDP ribazoletransferase [Thermodesulfovibrionales bacterium]